MVFSCIHGESNVFSWSQNYWLELYQVAESTEKWGSTLLTSFLFWINLLPAFFTIKLTVSSGLGVFVGCFCFLFFFFFRTYIQVSDYIDKHSEKKKPKQPPYTLWAWLHEIKAGLMDIELMQMTFCNIWPWFSFHLCCCKSGAGGNKNPNSIDFHKLSLLKSWYSWERIKCSLFKYWLCTYEIKTVAIHRLKINILFNLYLILHAYRLRENSK